MKKLRVPIFFFFFKIIDKQKAEKYNDEVEYYLMLSIHSIQDSKRSDR